MTRQIHNLDPDEAFALLASSAQGLGDDVARARLIEHGPNVLSAPPRHHLLRTALKQVANLFCLLLLVSSALCFVADRMQPGEGMAVLGWALLGVAVLNALFSFAQELRAERAM